MPDAVVPVIMVSAKNDEANIVEGLTHGCNDFVRCAHTASSMLPANARPAGVNMLTAKGLQLPVFGLPYNPNKVGAPSIVLPAGGIVQERRHGFSLANARMPGTAKHEQTADLNTATGLTCRITSALSMPQCFFCIIKQQAGLT